MEACTAVGRGEKSPLCDPGSELLLRGSARESSTYEEDNKRDTKKSEKRKEKRKVMHYHLLFLPSSSTNVHLDEVQRWTLTNNPGNKKKKKKKKKNKANLQRKPSDHGWGRDRCHDIHPLLLLFLPSDNIA